MKTIAQQLGIKKFPFEINDDEGNQIYCENSHGFWYKQEYGDKRNVIYYENSNGFWYKQEYGEEITCGVQNGEGADNTRLERR